MIKNSKRIPSEFQANSKRFEPGSRFDVGGSKVFAPTATSGHIPRWVTCQYRRQQLLDGSGAWRVRMAAQAQAWSQAMNGSGLTMIRSGRSLLQQADASATGPLPVLQFLNHTHHHIYVPAGCGIWCLHHTHHHSPMSMPAGCGIWCRRRCLRQALPVHQPPPRRPPGERGPARDALGLCDGG